MSWMVTCEEILDGLWKVVQYNQSCRGLVPWNNVLVISYETLIKKIIAIVNL